MKINSKKYFKALSALEDEFYEKVQQLEKVMEKETGIDGIQFFVGCDGHYCGIGTPAEPRRMPLIHRS